MSNYFMDLEFAETGGKPNPTIDLISIGIVAEEGHAFYAESLEFDIVNCNEWVITNVVSKLGPPKDRLSRANIAKGVKRFLGQNPIIHCYYGSYDWVCFCWLFGTMMDLPEGYPMMPIDLQQMWIQQGKPEGVKPPDPEGEHNALVDAKWNLQLYKNLLKHDTDRLQAFVNSNLY